MTISAFSLFTAVLIALAALTSGCGNKDDAKTATQVAAKVNSDEITVHQINNVLARSQNVTPDIADRVKREILDKLIDQQLARQQAVERKLDREPSVMQAVEAAKNEILARSYLERIASRQSKPSPEEVKKYYMEHPELFAQRRVFDLEELAFVAKDEVVAELREQSVKARSMKDIAEWLQSRGVKFAVNRGVRAAEQIPLEVLPKVQTMKEGEIRLLDAGGGRYQVIRVLASKPVPVDEATATPRIQQFLVNRRSSEAIAREMKQVRSEAKITYFGEFASDATAAAAKVQTEAEANVKAPVEAKSKVGGEAKAR